MAIGQSNCFGYATNMSEQRVTGLVLLSMAFAGSNVVFGRILSAELSSVAIGFFSLSVALLAIFPLQLRHVDELQRFERRDWMHMFCQAFFGIVLFRVLTVEGVKLTSGVDAGIILSATPAAMTVLAVLMLKERPSSRKLIAVLLAVAALAVVSLGSGSETSAATPRAYNFEEGPAPRLVGNVLILLAVFSDSLMTIFRRKSGLRVPHVTNTTVLLAISFLLFGVAMLVERPAIGTLSGQSILLLAVIGLFGTTIGYLLWGYGAARIPAATTAVTVAALPLTAVLLGALLLGEAITFRHLTGGTIGIVSMVLGAMPTKRRVPKMAERC